VFTFTGIGGSNPSLSAITFVVDHLQVAPHFSLLRGFLGSITVLE